MTTPCKRRDRGFSIVELAVSATLAVFVIGGVVVVQNTATSGFVGAVGEQRATSTMRKGVGDMKSELRSILSTSIEISSLALPRVGTISAGAIQLPVYNPLEGATYNIFNNQRMLRFQEAVSFDASTGATTFGGGSEVGGTVEYVVVASDLVRRVRTASGELVPAEERIVVSNLDVSNAFGSPVEFTWDEASGYLTMRVRTDTMLNGQRVRRNVETVVHLESVFQY